MFLIQYLAEGYQALYKYVFDAYSTSLLISLTSLICSTSATKSGILLLPLIITNVFILIISGRIVARFGR
jgi:hypothetical protein